MTSPGYWVTLLLKAVQTGFSGSLSTVSTFVAEVLFLSPRAHIILPWGYPQVYLPFYLWHGIHTVTI